MSRPPTSPPKAARSGSVAVELALILPMMFMLMFAMFQFGRIFWQYNAVQKAATDAARLLAAMSPADMQDSAKVNIAKTMAQQIVVDAAAEASIRPAAIATDVAVTFYCGTSGTTTCAYSPSATNRVTQATVAFDFTLADDGFYDFGPAWSAWVANITLHAESTMPVTN